MADGSPDLRAVSLFMKKFILCILLVLPLVSCGRGSRLPADLRLAEELVSSQPDSSLAILDAAGYAASASPYLRASHCLIRTYAEYNAYRPSIGEAQMREGVSYFLRHGTRERKALAHYLRAVVSEVNGNGDEALRANDLLRACKLVKGSGDHRLAALVNLRYASLLDERKWYDASLPYLQTGLHEAELVGSVALQVTALINMAYRALFLGDDSRDYSEAVSLSQKALQVAGNNDRDSARALYALAACYSRDGQFDKALDCSQRSVRIQERLVREGIRKEAVRYTVLGDAFRKMNMPDSALLYARKSMESPDIVARMSGTQLSYIVYRDLLHDNDNAVKYLTEYNALRDQQSASQQNDKVITEREDIEKSDIRASRARVITVAAVVVTLLSVLLYVLHRRLVMRRSDLVNKEQEIALGQAQLQESESERSSLRSTLMYQDKLVSSLQEKPRYLGEDEFGRLETILNEVCGRFAERLKADFPEMTAAEMRMAVLMRFGFSGKQIATMLGISPTSVTKGKQRLKARVASRLTSGSCLDNFIANY